MKKKNLLKRILAGIAIGVSSAIPGVSGGTMAIIFKVYDKIIWAISNLFKSFKRSISILLPVLLGLLIGIIPTMIAVDKALSNFLFGLICIFAGFIIGSIPQITNEIKDSKKTKWNIIALISALIISIGLGIASVLAKADTTPFFENPQWWFYLIMIPVGFLAASALVVPGISGGMILILLGFYSNLITKTVDIAKECLQDNWSRFGQQFGILCCFAIGVIIGFYFISKLMNNLLSKHREITFFAILGFVSGSVVSLFYNFEIVKYYDRWISGETMPIQKEVEIPLGIALLTIALIGGLLLVKYQRNHSQETID